MNQSTNRRIGCFLAALLVGISSQAENPPQKKAPNGATVTAIAIPSPDARPWIYNHWLGSAVDKENLTRELERYQKAGIGGIHIIPIYGVKGAESRFIPYLSPKWMEMMAFAVEEGKRLGLQVDMTTGTGWCFGGPWITKELGGCKVVRAVFPFPADGKLPPQFSRAKIEAVQAFGPNGESKSIGVTSDKRLDWNAPSEGWKVVALGHEAADLKVKRAAPGGEGRMINPFNPEAMRVYLERFSKAFDQPGTVKPRAMYHDSYEYYGTDWSPALLEAFEQRRGYKLQDELATFAGQGDPKRVARVRCDYRETLSDLQREAFSLWSVWCKQRGILTRNQAHGAPSNFLDLYALADIPETEMFGHGGPDPRISQFDENIGKADRDVLISKFASSSAHVAGKLLTASETGTWLAEHFCESFEELKGLIDLFFLSGVNHVFFHGSPYSPDDAAWPGWLFYAATQYTPRNPLWREAPTLNGYIERCQSLLREGRPDNDLLLYWPVHDLWTKGAVFMFGVHQREWLTQESTGKAARLLWNQGFGFDYVSDALLAPLRTEENLICGPDGAAWKAVLIPSSRCMPVATLEKLINLAKEGAAILFENQLPADVPGLGNLEARQEQMKQLLSQLSFTELRPGVRCASVGKGRVMVGTINELLAASAIQREKLADHPGLKYVRRKSGNQWIYFLVNHATAPLAASLPLAVNVTAATAFDPMTGKSGAVPVTVVGDSRKVALRIEPGHSLFLRTSTIGPQRETLQPMGFAQPGRESSVINGPWQVEFVAGGPTLPNTFAMSDLKSWAENGDPACEAFSGTARYCTTFDFTGNAAVSLLLDLGDVRHVCRIRLNGKEVGSLIMRPYRIKLAPGVLKARGNQLELEVSNLGANRVRDLDRRKVPWKIFHEINFVNIKYAPFDASNWPVMKSGLLGPVRLVEEATEGALPRESLGPRVVP
jgi:hypothetical protein